MKTIWKYPLIINDAQAIEMPAGAKILTAQMQMDQFCMWVLVDDTQPVVRRVFSLLGTGHPLPDLPNTVLKYITTIQLTLVWHLFEVVSTKVSVEAS